MLHLIFVDAFSYTLRAVGYKMYNPRSTGVKCSNQCHKPIKSLSFSTPALPLLISHSAAQKHSLQHIKGCISL
ncbi:hypothetical protein EAM_2095 [Erwinia amylovora ATCC 49946]|nr:hypothetical protein EAM_2095 [Erwinia amylovora ATCC 49946]